MNTPPLTFSRKWNRSIKSSRLRLQSFKWLSRENVVMHVSTKGCASRMGLRRALGHTAKKTGHFERQLPIENYSDADLDSPFSHLRFNTLRSGKILRFEKNGNLIRGEPWW